jgi:hypothetical protein
MRQKLRDSGERLTRMVPGEVLQLELLSRTVSVSGLACAAASPAGSLRVSSQTTYSEVPSHPLVLALRFKPTAPTAPT